MTVSSSSLPTNAIHPVISSTESSVFSRRSVRVRPVRSTRRSTPGYRRTWRSTSPTPNSSPPTRRAGGGRSSPTTQGFHALLRAGRFEGRYPDQPHHGVARRRASRRISTYRKRDPMRKGARFRDGGEVNPILRTTAGLREGGSWLGLRDRIHYCRTQSSAGPQEVGDGHGIASARLGLRCPVIGHVGPACRVGDRAESRCRRRVYTWHHRLAPRSRVE